MGIRRRAASPRATSRPRPRRRRAGRAPAPTRLTEGARRASERGSRWAPRAGRKRRSLRGERGAWSVSRISVLELWGTIGRRVKARGAAPRAASSSPAPAAAASGCPPEVRMKKLLLQLDPDRNPSAFDRIVAYDAGADEVLSYGGVTAADVTPLVHGAIFTRGPADLKNTAVWVGGTDVATAEALFKA